MKRKTFIQLSTTLMATPLISTLSGWAQASRLKNWAGNLTFSTDNVQYPKSVTEVDLSPVVHTQEGHEVFRLHLTL